MKYVSRSQWYSSLVDAFLESGETSLKIDLFTNEVKRLEKRYPIVIDVGPTLSATDLRHSCIIKKEDA